MEKWKLKVEKGNVTSPSVDRGVVYFGSENGCHAVNAETGREIWTFKTDGPGALSPSPVSNGIVYYLSTKALYALDCKTGQERWKFGIESAPASPAVFGEAVVVAGKDGVVRAVNTRTAQQTWQYQTGVGAAPIWSTPAIVDGIVYFGGSSSDGYLYALNVNTGGEKWKFKTGTPIMGSPAVHNGVAYIGSGLNVYAVDTHTGREKWLFKTKAPANRSDKKSDSKFDFQFSIVFDVSFADGVLYFGASDHHLYAVDAESGKEKWKFKTETEDNFLMSPAIADGVVFFGSGRSLYAVE